MILIISKLKTAIWVRIHCRKQPLGNISIITEGVHGGSTTAGVGWDGVGACGGGGGGAGGDGRHQLPAVCV